LKKSRENKKSVTQEVILLLIEPLPNPPLKQIRGGYKSLWLKVLHPFPYCLREGDGGRVQKNKKWKNNIFETPTLFKLHSNF
jgi:hypothetical protein